MQRSRGRGSKHLCQCYWRSLFRQVTTLALCLLSIGGLHDQAYANDNLAATTLEIPFAYPNRPTVYAEIDGMIIPLLFDTGTNRSILLDTGHGSLPSGLVFSVDSLQVASKDNKPAEWVQSGYLRYACAGDVNLGGDSVTDMLFRVYRAGSDQVSDYQGALSPLQFGATHVIEVLNSESKIVLTPHGQWVAPEYTLDFPLVVLPRGIFIPLLVEDRAIWFQLDTGFSGEMAVTLEANLGHALSPDEYPAKQAFKGWGSNVELTPYSTPIVILQGYSPKGLPIIYKRIHSGSQKSYLHPEDFYLLPQGFFQEITSLEVGGIIGAGFFRDYDYSLDLSNGWLYLQSP